MLCIATNIKELMNDGMDCIVGPQSGETLQAQQWKKAMKQKANSKMQNKLPPVSGNS